MDTQAQTFIDETTLASLLHTDPALLDHAAVTSYECLQNGQLHEAEVISRGLVAANHRFWYYRTLLAVSLQRLGRVAEAIDQTNEGLKYQPGHPELLGLKAVLVLLPTSQPRPVQQPRAVDELMIPRSMRA